MSRTTDETPPDIRYGARPGNSASSVAGKASRALIVHPFSAGVVRETVVGGCKGAYTLGSLVGGVYTVGYVGRSDRCVRERLVAHELLGEFDAFAVRYADDAPNAFVLECAFWHELHDAGLPMLNRVHPATPRHSGLACPYCAFARGVEQLLAA